jgi:hypothetical protein
VVVVVECSDGTWKVLEVHELRGTPGRGRGTRKHSGKGYVGVVHHEERVGVALLWFPGQSLKENLLSGYLFARAVPNKHRHAH